MPAPRRLVRRLLIGFGLIAGLAIAAVALLPPAGGYERYTYTCGGASLAASTASASRWMGPAVPAAVNVDASSFRSKGSRKARPT